MPGGPPVVTEASYILRGHFREKSVRMRKSEKMDFAKGTDWTELD